MPERLLPSTLASLPVELQGRFLVLTEAPPLDCIAIGHLVSLDVDDPEDGLYRMTATLLADPDARALKRPDVLNSNGIIGRAILGHRIGDHVTASSPEGQIDIAIVDIQPSPLLEPQKSPA